MAKSCTQYTLAELKRLGYRPEVVERYCSFTRRRHDLFGCIDVVALRGDCTGLLGIQSTSASNLSARVSKVLSLDADGAISDWLSAGNRLECWGWRKFAKPVERKWWRANRKAIVLGTNGLKVNEL